MKLILSKSAVKFLKKIPAKDSQKVKDKIHRLLYLAVEIDLTQSKELDIKTLKGDL
jgi:mRNA-degrading endonuclease RelE of RelBE toxin-antitoxin system